MVNVWAYVQCVKSKKYFEIPVEDIDNFKDGKANKIFKMIVEGKQIEGTVARAAETREQLRESIEKRRPKSIPNKLLSSADESFPSTSGTSKRTSNPTDSAAVNNILKKRLAAKNAERLQCDADFHDGTNNENDINQSNITQNNKCLHTKETGDDSVGPQIVRDGCKGAEESHIAIGEQVTVSDCEDIEGVKKRSEDNVDLTGVETPKRNERTSPYQFSPTQFDIEVGAQEEKQRNSSRRKKSKDSKVNKSKRSHKKRTSMDRHSADDGVTNSTSHTNRKQNKKPVHLQEIDELDTKLSKLCKMLEDQQKEQTELLELVRKYDSIAENKGKEPQLFPDCSGLPQVSFMRTNLETGINEVHIGQDIWISHEKWCFVTNRARSSAHFTKVMTAAIFTTNELKESSALGGTSNCHKVQEKKPALDSVKMAALQDSLVWYLLTHDKDMQNPAEARDNAAKKVAVYVSSKITDIRKPPRTKKNCNQKKVTKPNSKGVRLPSSRKSEKQNLEPSSDSNSSSTSGSDSSSSNSSNSSDSESEDSRNGDKETTVQINNKKKRKHANSSGSGSTSDSDSVDSRNDDKNKRPHKKDEKKRKHTDSTVSKSEDSSACAKKKDKHGSKKQKQT